MRFSTAILSASAIALIGGTAMAQDSNVYINAGVDAYEFDAYAISGKLGYDFNDYFGLEGQASIGIGGDDEATFDQVVNGNRVEGSISSDVDSTFAAFARVKFPVSDRVEVFARGGYHFTQLGFETSNFQVTSGDTVGVINGTEDNLDFDGFAAGAGAQFMVDPLNGIRIEYTFLDVDEIEGIDVGEDVDFGEFGSDVYSISYVRKF